MELEFDVLDHGYVRFIESWGSDERVIESARMSTNKSFQGWGGVEPCPECEIAGALYVDGLYKTAEDQQGRADCKVCKGSGKKPGDEKLLKFLWDHGHHTPFEMAGLTLEVQAPLFVFREWHRHRTQSYNELSARYTPVPDVNYMPTLERCTPPPTSNKQAQGHGIIQFKSDDDRRLSHVDWLQQVAHCYDRCEAVYRTGLDRGIPKEVARIVMPVGRYSRMRASANLRNWLHFLTLRTDKDAQLEIRKYAQAVEAIVLDKFPRTHQLFRAAA